MDCRTSRCARARIMARNLPVFKAGCYNLQIPSRVNSLLFCTGKRNYDFSQRLSVIKARCIDYSFEVIGIRAPFSHRNGVLLHPRCRFPENRTNSISRPHGCPASTMSKVWCQTRFHPDSFRFPLRDGPSTRGAIIELLFSCSAFLQFVGPDLGEIWWQFRNTKI